VDSGAPGPRRPAGAILGLTRVGLLQLLMLGRKDNLAPSFSRTGQPLIAGEQRRIEQCRDRNVRRIVCGDAPGQFEQGCGQVHM
jgi:hypothetical protein